MEITKRQQDIVNAAIHLIAQNGLCDLTTKNLAREVHVTEAALYRHFSGKNEMLMTILEYFNSISDGIIQSIEERSLSPLERVRAFVSDRYELFESQPDLARVMFTDELFNADRSLSENIISIMHRHRDAVVSYINEAQADGIIRSDIPGVSIFRIIVGSMRFLITQWNLSNRAFPLREEGIKLFNNIEIMIKEKQ